MTFARPSLVAAFLLAACFNPDLSKRTVRCDSENPCSDGSSCFNNLCVQGTSADASMDASNPTPNDLTPVGPSGCAENNGTYLGAAWACPGRFGGSNPAPSKRCATGWSVCGSGTGINLVGCRGLNGFFMSSFLGRNTSGTTVTCSQGGGGDRGVFGCGKGGANQQSPCMGFEQALLCTSSPDWQCSDQFDQVRNDNAENGVLCCK